jgi:hypothetical protein
MLTEFMRSKRGEWCNTLTFEELASQSGMFAKLMAKQRKKSSVDSTLAPATTAHLQS